MPKETETIKIRKSRFNVSLFLAEFLRTYHTTGAVLPSSRWLAKALALNVKHVDKPSEPRSILEVGPGTGAVTEKIVRAMQPGDRLDLVELNDRFVARLRDRLEQESAFRAVAPRTRILHCKVEDLPQDKKYDLIVSGLPLNNFSTKEVQHILKVLMSFLKPAGVLSFFQYIGIRKVKALVSQGHDRKRLREIGQLLADFFKGRETRRDWIWLNVPPAWVHHIRHSR